MNDRFANELTAFVTTLTFANHETRIAVWQNQVPMSFGTKLGELATEVAAVQDWAQAQGASIAGSAESKDAQETELEQAVFEMAQALVTYFMDEEDLEAAEPFRRTFSYWQGLRDQELLGRTQAVLDVATPLTVGPGALGIANNYGVSAARVAALAAERAEYEAVVSAPAAARAGRKALTTLMRQKFRPVTAKFRDLDRLVTQFRPRPGGEAFVTGWFAARQVIDAGHGPGTGGGSGSGGGTPNPLKAIIDSLTVTVAGAVALAFHATGVGAVTFRVLEKGENGEFAVIATGLTVGEFTTEPGAGTRVFKVIATDETGDGPESEEATVVVPA